MDLDLIGRRVSVLWPEEDKWFQGAITEKGQDPASAPGVYNNVGWRVEYDDGDIAWVIDVNDVAKVKFIDANGDEESVNRMTPVATSVAEHVSGTMASAADTAAPQGEDKASAVDFKDKAEIVPGSE